MRLAQASLAKVALVVLVVSASTPSGRAVADTAAEPRSIQTGVKPGDWPQWGGSPARNNTPEGQNIPTEWNVGTFDLQTGELSSKGAKNIKWSAGLGSQSYGNPVVANGHVYVGTNNGRGYLKRYPPQVDLGVLLCFNEADGKFLWQHSSEKLPSGRVNDWPLQGICCAPLVDGDRLWYVTSRGEVVCLDTEGFRDGQDDGQVKGELARLFEIVKDEDPAKDKVAKIQEQLKEGKVSTDLADRFALVEMQLPIGKVKVSKEDRGFRLTFTPEGQQERQVVLRQEGPKLVAYKALNADDRDEADVVWKFDMMKELGTFQHNMCSCSVTAAGNLLFINTSNGVDEGHVNLPAPNAPTFVCMLRHTGRVLWTDNSPGEFVLHGQWSSPTYGVLGGVPQVLFGAGDGWLYSFRAEATNDGRPELLWKFDCNPKESKYALGGRATRNHLIATPVIHDGLVYVGVGEDPEHGEGVGHLWCIDPTKRGDVSDELAVRRDNPKEAVPRRRMQAVVAPEEVAIPNPNSAKVWHYSGFDANQDGKLEPEETMHRTCGTVAIKNGLLFVADFSGFFHCLDLKTGSPHWVYDMMAECWGSPLIVEEKVYVGNSEGDIFVFKLADEEELLAQTNMGSSVYSTPIVANNVLYIADKDYLFAIEQEEKPATASKATADSSNKSAAK